MVGTGNFCARLQHFRTAIFQKLIAKQGVPFHQFKFFIGQFAGFKKNVVADGNLADIVHRCCLQDQLALRRRQIQPPGDDLRVLRHALDVRPGFRIAELGGAR